METYRVLYMQVRSGARRVGGSPTRVQFVQAKTEADAIKTVEYIIENRLGLASKQFRIWVSHS